jgi:hypothetical protein
MGVDVDTDQAAQLRELLDREAIRNLMVQASRGVDRVSAEILLPLYHEDSLDIHGGFRGSGREFAELPSRSSPTNLAGHHLLGQSCIDLDGGTAVVETYFVYHYERFASKRNHVRVGYMAGRYLDKIEKRDGVWRFTVRRVVIDTGSEQSKADEPPGLSSFPRGQRWPDDDVFHPERLSIDAQ